MQKESGNSLLGKYYGGGGIFLRNMSEASSDECSLTPVSSTRKQNMDCLTTKWHKTNKIICKRLG